MSNDQSPPVRKVIPYKKGGPRKSPFSDMAFQFSGTALDVAIQQREEEVESAPPEISEAPIQELSNDEPDPANNLTPEVEASKEVKDEISESPLYPPTAAQDPSPSPPAAALPKPRPAKRPTRDVRLVPNKKARPATTEETDPRLQSFITRWGPFLTETQLGICIHVYNNSEAVGQEYCFTSIAKLKAAISKTERQVKTVLNQLTDWGFLVRGETLVNTSRENRGTHYKLLVDKS
ncbi:MAG TPA: hypothetical protein VF666_08630 [Pyrinomonadaceae bacterium]